MRTPRVGFFSTPAFFANWHDEQQQPAPRHAEPGADRRPSAAASTRSTRAPRRCSTTARTASTRTRRAPATAATRRWTRCGTSSGKTFTYSYHAQHDPAQVFSTAIVRLPRREGQARRRSTTSPARWSSHPLYAERLGAEALLLRQLERLLRGRSGVPARRARRSPTATTTSTRWCVELFSSPLVTGAEKTKTWRDVGRDGQHRAPGSLLRRR